MNSYEYLQEEAREDGVNVIDYPFDNNRIRGLYCDGTVAIRQRTMDFALGGEHLWGAIGMDWNASYANVVSCDRSYDNFPSSTFTRGRSPLTITSSRA